MFYSHFDERAVVMVVMVAVSTHLLLSILMLHTGVHFGLAGMVCLSDIVVRMHALVHAMAAAVAKALADASPSDFVFEFRAPLSSSASASLTASHFPSSADVRFSAQQLQFIFRDMIAFVRCVSSSVLCVYMSVFVSSC